VSVRGKKNLNLLEKTGVRNLFPTPVNLRRYRKNPVRMRAPVRRGLIRAHTARRNFDSQGGVGVKEHSKPKTGRRYRKAGYKNKICASALREQEK